MAGSVNKVILIGNLGQDPEIRSFQNGGKFANLSIATGESWKDKATGDRKEKTDWHRVVVTADHLVSVCEKYLKKGAKVYVEGQLETRKFQKDGRDVYTTEVVLRPYRGTLTMLDSRGGSSSSASAADEYLGDGAYPNGPSQGAGPALPDDEIPF